MAARPRTISNEALLDVARAVFIRDGAHATTRTIAREAGVSEATIFKRFGTKDELFTQACCPVAWSHDLLARFGEGEIEAQLAAIMRDLVRFHREVMPLTMLRVAHGGFDPRDHFRALGDRGPRGALRRLADHLGAEMQRGRLAGQDPLVLAQVLLGATRAFAFFEMIGAHGDDPDAQIDADTFAARTARLLMRGLIPGAETPPPA